MTKRTSKKAEAAALAQVLADAGMIDAGLELAATKGLRAPRISRKALTMQARRSEVRALTFCGTTLVSM